MAVLPLADSEKRGRQLLPTPPFPDGSYEVDYPFEKDGEYLSDRIAGYLAEKSELEVLDREKVASLLADQEITSQKPRAMTPCQVSWQPKMTEPTKR